MKFRHLLVSSALPALMILACGGKSETFNSTNPEDPTNPGDGDGDLMTSASSSAGKGESCQELCEKIAECGDGTISECTDSCTGNTTVSRLGQEALTECIDEAICEGERDTALWLSLVCVSSKAVGTELSATQRKYCEETVDLLNACLDGEPSEEGLDCRDNIAVASDEAIEPFIACGELPCDRRQACVDAASLQLVAPLLPALLSGDLESGEADPDLLISFLAIGAIGAPLNQTEEPAFPGFGGAPGF